MRREVSSGFRTVVAIATFVFLGSFGLRQVRAEEAATWEKRTAQAVIATKHGKIAEATSLWRMAMDLAEKFDPQDPRVARTHMLLGEIHRRDQQPARAEQSFKSAVSVTEISVGPRHRNMIDPLEALANFYYYTNRIGEVAPLYRQIFDIVEQAAEPNESEIAIRARNLADVYQLQGRYAEAEPLFQKTLALTEKSAGKDPDLLAGHLLANADFYRTWRKFDQAENLALRAMAIHELRTDSDGALALGVCLDKLAEIHLASSQPAKAESHYRRSLAIIIKAAGPDNPDLAPRLCGLASALNAQGKHQEAETHFQNAIRVTELGLGRDVPELAPILTQYADFLRQLGKASEADTHRQRAEAIRNQQEGS